MLDAPKVNNLNTKDFHKSDSNVLSAESHESLKQCEQQWWQARQQLITLKERKIFWYGESRAIMWFLWQMASYVVVAIALLLLVRVLNIELSVWQYSAVFGVQTLIFVMMFASRGKLAAHLQTKIDQADLAREQALNEMIILASDSIIPEIHANAPISLQQVYERYDAQFRMASLQRLLQEEIDAGRLILAQHQIESEVLPPELIEDGLLPHTGEMVYRSLIHPA